MIDGTTAALTGLAAVMALVLLHVPIGVAMGVVGIAGYAAMISFDVAMSVLVIEAGSVLTRFDMAIIPLFLLMGAFVVAGGLADDMYLVAEAALGGRRGGLTAASILSCALFGSVAGSATSTTATFSRIAIPQMVRRGYDPGFAGGAVAVGGTLGVMIPPSIIMAIYALMTEQFVIDLFVAAIVPAAMAVLSYLVVVALVARRRPDLLPRGEALPRAARLQAFRRGWLTLAMLLVMTIAIYSGLMTLVEAAALGAVLSFALAAGRRRLDRPTLEAALTQTATATVMIYVSIIGASVLASFIGLTQVAGTLVGFIGALSLPPVGIVLAFIVMYLILGAFFDEVAVMMLTLPFVFPVIVGLGYDPVWWGIINVVVINLGMIIPPIGINVFMINSLFPQIGLRRLYAGVMPFILVDLVRLGLLVAFPGLSLWLLALMR